MPGACGRREHTLLLPLQPPCAPPFPRCWRATPQRPGTKMAFRPQRVLRELSAVMTDEDRRVRQGRCWHTHGQGCVVVPS